VHDDEGRKSEHAQKVNATRGLTAAENLQIPRETSGNRRRHSRTRCNRDRRNYEDNSKIRELLERVVGSRSLYQMEAGIIQK
jgi:hypothetical protein